MQEASTPLLLTPEAAATYLSQSRSTVYELMGTGELPSIKIGRSRRITMAALERYVDGLSSQLRPEAS